VFQSLSVKHKMAIRIHSFPAATLDDFLVPQRRRRNDFDFLPLVIGRDFDNGFSLGDKQFRCGPDVKVDVVERANDFQVYVDLPGVDIKDVDLQVADGLLHLSAKREQVHEEKSEYSHRIERSFGQVKRSVPIPKTALPESADAKFENGVLTVQFTKRPALEAGPKKLAIRSSCTGNNSCHEESGVDKPTTGTQLNVVSIATESATTTSNDSNGETVTH
jgi:HSP20 family molecular chaperone IbpA